MHKLDVKENVKQSRGKGRNLPALKKVGGDLLKVAGELSRADRAILTEVALNRRGILKLAQVSLDHEKRLRGLEESVAELSGASIEDLIELDKDTAEGTEEEEQDPDAL